MCQQAHSFMWSGTCPWCHSIIQDGQIATDHSSSLGAAIQWKESTLHHAVSQGYPDHAFTALRCVMFSNSTDKTMLSILEAGLLRKDHDISALASDILFNLGRTLCPSNAQEYEIAIPVKSPTASFALRIILLGFYFTRARESRQWEMNRSNHLLWIVNHHPRSYIAGTSQCQIESKDLLYESARNSWRRHIEEHPDDLTILANAISFFVSSDRSYCISLCNKGKQLAPNDAKWPERLGLIYELNHDWQHALQEYENALERTEQSCRFELLPRIAKVALAAQEFEKARTMVEELAQVDYPANRHDTFLLLGRCACVSGDIESAKGCLIKAADFPCAPGSGPSLALAKELLERGERSVVIEYLKLCSGHWTLGVERLRYWIEEIERGGVPEFGANLYY